MRILKAVVWPFLTTSVCSALFGFIPDWLHFFDFGHETVAVAALHSGYDGETSNVTLSDPMAQWDFAVTEELQSLRYGTRDVTSYVPITPAGWTPDTPVTVLLKLDGYVDRSALPTNAIAGRFENKLFEGADEDVTDHLRTESSLHISDDVLIFVREQDQRVWPFILLAAVFLFSLLGSFVILKGGPAPQPN